MSLFDDIELALQDSGHTLYTGYPPTGATVPYAVQRPLELAPVTQAIAGVAIDWDDQAIIYACGASVEASYNLAVAIMQILHGARSGSTTLYTSMGYVGAQVEGHYESTVTVQRNQGDI